jgi:metalloendopeptidase OMA1, mitochondrial
MIEAGVEDVQEHVTKWPVNIWPKDKSLKEMGKMTMVNMYDGLEGSTFRLWERAFGKTMEETEVFLVDVRKDLLDRKIHSYAKM